MPNKSSKLWSGRFSKKSAKLLSEFNDSLSFDKRLYKEDIEGSIAHAHGLSSAKVLTKKEASKIITTLKKIKLTKKHYKTILPGYTHLKKAKAITLGHYLLAYEQKLKRDLERFPESIKRINVLPLGAGAVAGAGFKINRNLLATKLGFLIFHFLAFTLANGQKK